VKRGGWTFCSLWRGPLWPHPPSHTNAPAPPPPISSSPGAHLDTIARRVFVVLRPLRVDLVNVPPEYLAQCEAPYFPRDPTLGSRALPITACVYIDRADFREVDDPTYYGLAPGKAAGLRYAGYVRVVEVCRGADGEVSSLRAEYDHTRGPALLGAKGAAPKGNLHWVSSPTPGGAPLAVTVRLYDHLFLNDVPGESGDWESEINPNSEEVVAGALGEASLAAAGGAPAGAHFQFERAGYFVVDKDSTPGALVFNSTVALKESVETKKVKGGKA
jgi:glutaminyl-tRNA synthetase